MHRLKIMIVGVVLMAVLGSALSAESLRIIPFGGLSKDMRSVTSNRWNMGFTLGAQIFSPVSQSFWIGGRIAFHSWSIDGQGWFNDLFPDYFTFLSASGSQSVFEIIPSLRYLFTTSEGGLNIAGQVGAGLIYVGGSEATIQGSFHTTYSSGQETRTYSSSGMIGFGIQLGLPLTLGKIVEVMPIYTLYLAGGDFYHHIALNVGIHLGK